MVMVMKSLRSLLLLVLFCIFLSSVTSDYEYENEPEELAIYHRSLRGMEEYHRQLHPGPNPLMNGACGAYRDPSLTNYSQILSNLLNPLILDVTALTALRGQKNVRVGVNLDADPTMISFGIGTQRYQPVSGLMFSLWNEISRRGGFTVKYVLVGNRTSYRSTNDFLNDVLCIRQTIDIYGAAPITDTDYRRNNLYIGFTRKVVDSSVIFMSTSQTYKTSPTWGFLSPFSSRLWGSILALVVAHGMVYYCADKAQRVINHRIKQAKNPGLTVGVLGGNTVLANALAGGGPPPTVMSLGALGIAQDANVMPMDDEDEFEHENLDSEGEVEKSRGPLTFTRSVYASLLHFADGEPHQEPAAYTTRTLRVGYHFWIFVITASYIANLANIYISNEKIRVGIATIDDANTQSASVCVLTGGGAFNTNNGQGRCFDCYISGTPYDIANLTYASTQLVSINSDDPSEIFKGIYNKSCGGALIQQYQYDALFSTIKGNPSCSVIQTGPTVRTISGSWPLLMDYAVQYGGDRGTSVIELVVSTQLAAMREDGTYDTIYNNAIAAASNNDCEKVRKSFDEVSLVIADVIGIFYLYFIMLGLAIVVVIVANVQMALCPSKTKPPPMDTTSPIAPIDVNYPDFGVDGGNYAPGPTGAQSRYSANFRY